MMGTILGMMLLCGMLLFFFAIEQTKGFTAESDGGISLAALAVALVASSVILSPLA